VDQSNHGGADLEAGRRISRCDEASTARVALRWVMLAAALLGGCTSMSQDPGVVLVREPGNRTYNPPVPVVDMA